MLYDEYNREERTLCAHLFRLLHEGLSSKPETSGLAGFLEVAVKGECGGQAVPEVSSLKWRNVAVHCEVALLRDAYQARKPRRRDDRDALNTFMNHLVEIICERQGVANCTPYSELPGTLGNCQKTHPRQIAHHAREAGLLSPDELQVYATLQGMFNAKPDLAVTIDDWLIVVEAKLTEPFSREQLERTANIALVWEKLLLADLGFQGPVRTCLLRLGLQESRPRPHVSWEDILGVARRFYGDSDRSVRALECAVQLHVAKRR